MSDGCRRCSRRIPCMSRLETVKSWAFLRKPMVKWIYLRKTGETTTITGMLH